MENLNENKDVMNDVVSGVEPVKKRTGAIIGGITAGVLVVAVGGGFAAYATSDFVKNQVKLRLSKPESYYSWVIEKNSSEFASQVADRYREMLEEQKNGQTAEIALKYQPSDDVKKELIDMADDDEMFTSIINNVNEISIGCDWMEKEELSSGNIYAALNGDKLVSLEAAVNAITSDFMFRIPEINEQWVLINEIMDDTDELKYQDPESIITPDELEELVAKYTALYNNLIEDVEIEKKEEVAVGDITVNYTIAEVTLTESKAEEIAVEFLNTIKSDELIRSIAVDRIGELTNDEFDQMIDDAIEDIKDDDDSSDETAVFKTYIDPKGQIRGAGITIENESNDELLFIMGKDGDEVRGEAYLTNNGEEEFRADLNLTETDDVCNGTLEMVADDTTVKVDFIDITEVDKDKHFVSGKLAVTMSDEYDTYTTEIALNGDSDSQQFSSDIIVDEVNYGKIIVELSSENSAEPVFPDTSDAYVLTEDSDFPVDYAEQDKVTDFIKSVLEKIGLDSETAQMLAEAASDDVYNPYDYYDDYDSDFGGWDSDDDFMVDDFDIDTDDVDVFWSDDADDFEDVDVDSAFAGISVADESEAYIIVMDNEFSTFYGSSNSMFNGKRAEIKGNGKYTVSVESIPEGFESQEKKGPDGLYILGLELMGAEISENTEIEVLSVKIDGKDIKLEDAPTIECEDGLVSAVIYTSSFFDEEENGDSSEFANIGSWSSIEITFEIKGLD